MGKQCPQARRRDRQTAAEVARELKALEKMTTGELAEKYCELFGAPTRTRNKPHLKKRVAWRIQELAEGGLTETALARIEELAPLAPVRWRRQPGKQVGDGKVGGAQRLRDPRLPEPGTVLTRVHGGKEHKVKILASGFEYRRKRYRSLSAIARLISGTPWNGFLFFGLQSRAVKKDGRR